MTNQRFAEMRGNAEYGRTRWMNVMRFQRLSVLRPSWHRKDSGCASPGKWVQSRREEGGVLHEERGRLSQQMGGRVWETAPPPVWPGFPTFHLKKNSHSLMPNFVSAWLKGILSFILKAYQMRPSIIFFDEIDGIAPVRSSRQDQIHRCVSLSLFFLWRPFFAVLL